MNPNPLWRLRLAAIPASLLLAIVPSTAAHAAPATTPAANNNGPFPPVGFDPNAPGLSSIQALINTIGTYTLYAAIGGALVSLLILAIGPAAGFHQASRIGKIGLIISVLVAFALGIISVVLNAAFRSGAGG